MRSRLIGWAAAASLCLTAAPAGWAPAAADAEAEPSWKVFRELEDRTPPPVADAMLRLAGASAKDVVYDLGSGDGVIVVMAAKKYGARAFGVDINPEMVARARANAIKQGVADKATFAQGDLYETDLKPATVITLFLWPSMNRRLRPRLLELTPGTRIVSHEHDMGAWRPDRTAHGYDKRWGWRPLHFWIVPATIAGSWLMTVDGSKIRVEFRQTYQRFAGSASASGRSYRIRNGRIFGAKATFDLDAPNGRWKRYSGTLMPDGALAGRGWHARRTMSRRTM